MKRKLPCSYRYITPIRCIFVSLPFYFSSIKIGRWNKNKNTYWVFSTTCRQSYLITISYLLFLFFTKVKSLVIFLTDFFSNRICVNIDIDVWGQFISHQNIIRSTSTPRRCCPQLFIASWGLIENRGLWNVHSINIVIVIAFVLINQREVSEAQIFPSILVF